MKLALPLASRAGRRFEMRDRELKLWPVISRVRVHRDRTWPPVDCARSPNTIIMQTEWQMMNSCRVCVYVCARASGHEFGVWLVPARSCLRCASTAGPRPSFCRPAASVSPRRPFHGGPACSPAHCQNESGRQNYVSLNCVFASSALGGGCACWQASASHQSRNWWPSFR